MFTANDINNLNAAHTYKPSSAIFDSLETGQVTCCAKKKKKVVIVTETQVSICTEKGTAGLDTSC